MKNLMVTLALVVGLLSTSVSFADEITVSTKAVVEQTEKTADIVAFQDVESTVLSANEMEVAGAGFKSWWKHCIVNKIRNRHCQKTRDGFSCQLDS